jgi:hypothetical protein
MATTSSRSGSVTETVQGKRIGFVVGERPSREKLTIASTS